MPEPSDNTKSFWGAVKGIAFVVANAVGFALPDVNGVRNYVQPTSAASVVNGHSIDNVLKEIDKNPNYD